MLREENFWVTKPLTTENGPKLKNREKTPSLVHKEWAKLKKKEWAFHRPIKFGFLEPRFPRLKKTYGVVFFTQATTFFLGGAAWYLITARHNLCPFFFWKWCRAKLRGSREFRKTFAFLFVFAPKDFSTTCLLLFAEWRRRNTIEEELEWRKELWSETNW